MADTIYALSSGHLPAGIAVIRISGTLADIALKALSPEALPPARAALLRTLRWNHIVLDRALVLRFAAPASATGEDTVELHLHGGRATVAAVYDALGAQPGLRLADPGEFTRRAFLNGRLDLSEAEALGDLLQAETETQRRAAMRNLEGGLRIVAEDLRVAVLEASARVEAAIDFAEEGDVVDWPQRSSVLLTLVENIDRYLRIPPVERLRDGLKVVIAGPPNAGKSSLINALVGREVAITSSFAGTTRDAIEAPVILNGIPFVFVDTAGLRNDAQDAIEAVGIDRAEAWLRNGDIVVWLGDPDVPPDADNVLVLHAKSDLSPGPAGVLSASALTGKGLNRLVAELVRLASTLMPDHDGVTVNRRQRSCLLIAATEISNAAQHDDLLLVAEHLIFARRAIDSLVGRAGVEDMLDALFGQFCLGK